MTKRIKTYALYSTFIAQSHWEELVVNPAGIYGFLDVLAQPQVVQHNPRCTRRDLCATSCTDDQPHITIGVNKYCWAHGGQRSLTWGVKKKSEMHSILVAYLQLKWPIPSKSFPSRGGWPQGMNIQFSMCDCGFEMHPAWTVSHQCLVKSIFFLNLWFC